jgi:excisionase family DNA binding protein
VSPTPLTVSITTAAEMLGVSTQTVARYIKAGLLKAAKPKRRVLIRTTDIEAMLTQGALPGPRSGTDPGAPRDTAVTP